jgi:calpain-7
METRARSAEALFASSTGPEALEHAIRAAELYMRAAGEAASRVDAARLRRKCQQLISQAEAIKAGNPPPTPAAPDDAQAILTRSSRLHGNSFPPWTAPPKDDEFELEAGAEPFV